MKNLWRNRPILIALLASALFLLLAALTVGERTAGKQESLFHEALEPVQQYVSNLTDGVTDFFIRVFRPGDLQQENEELKKELLYYQRKAALYEETERENARLSELLDYTGEHPDLTFMAAAVTAKSFNPYVDTITLNAGTRNGVTEKMAVVCAQGIIGRVSEVGTGWCRVRTMQNEDMRISVMVERTRDEGLLGGLLEENGSLIGLKLYYLPKDAELEVGDTIVTSGLGGIFPKGLYVGEVISLGSEEDPYDAIVSLDVDFSHLETVLIVKGVGGN